MSQTGGATIRILVTAASRHGATAEIAGAREHPVFAGQVNKDRPGFSERAMVRAFRSAVGDFRDWEEIGGWAREIDARLTPSHL